MSANPYPNYDVRKIMQTLRWPRPDLVNVIAHRGLRLLGGSTENSLTAVAAAAKAGYEGVELDIRSTKDGQVVAFHDDGLGRLTNIPTPQGQTVYNPFTGEGYNPLVRDVAWKGFMDSLYLRDDWGNETKERPALFEEVLAFIRHEGINMVISLDVKDTAALLPAYEIILKWSNAAGVAALEWCSWKLSDDLIHSPKEWEAQPVFKTSSAAGHVLPFVPLISTEKLDTFEVMKSWSLKPYIFGYEFHYSRPGGPFQKSMDYFASDECPCKSTGGWLIGGDLPREYYTEPQHIKWDDSRVRKHIIANGIGNPTGFPEGQMASLSTGPVGSLVDGFVPQYRDYRLNVEDCLALGYTYLVGEPNFDLGEKLEMLGRRNVSRILNSAN